MREILGLVIFLLLLYFYNDQKKKINKMNDNIDTSSYKKILKPKIDKMNKYSELKKSFLFK